MLGVPFSRKPITVYSKGTANIIQAMKHHGLLRLVCVSSGGTKPHANPQEGFIFGSIIKAIVGKTTYADMVRMETLAMKSVLDWTIVRPARLFDAVMGGKYLRTAESWHHRHRPTIFLKRLLAYPGEALFLVRGHRTAARKRHQKGEGGAQQNRDEKGDRIAHS